MKRKAFSLITLGIPSLFLIFSVFCLIILSLLTYHTSQRELQMSESSLNQTTAYYQACSTASHAYAETEQLLKELHSSYPSSAEFFQMIDTASESISALEWNSQKQAFFGSFPITSRQFLHTEFKVVYPDTFTNTHLLITSWLTTGSDKWNPNTIQPVYKGENND